MKKPAIDALVSSSTSRFKSSRRASSLASALQQQVTEMLSPYVQARPRLLVAFSGGLDSRVLLQLLHTLQSALAFELQAMHVHHGLSPNADAWAAFCQETCAKLAIPLQVIKVDVPKDSGFGIEAAARQLRYQALLQAEADYVVLAHHQDDQAETLLLQLLRGAGVKGLSAMAGAQKRLLRPLLHCGRASLHSYAQEQKLTWIEDESNQDDHYERNFLRQHIMPVLQQRFPASSKAIARSAALLAESADLLQDLAAIDAKEALHHGQLQVASLTALSQARACNLMRWWLAQQGLAMPSQERLYEMLKQLLAAKSDTTLKVMVDSAKNIWLRRYQGYAYLEHAQATGFDLLWQGEESLALPDGSQLLFTPALGQGLAMERLAITRLRISQRKGGERFKPDSQRPTRTLKHLLQEAHIPPWRRQAIPLVYWQDSLAVVPNIGVACHLQAEPHEMGLQITWQSKTDSISP